MSDTYSSDPFLYRASYAAPTGQFGLLLWGTEGRCLLWFFLLFCFFKQGLSMKLRMASNFKSSCLSLPSRTCLYS